MFNGNRIAIGDSISVSDSIKIIEPGQTLHFEDDHAGAMAIMTQFDEATLKYALNSQYSKIASKANYLEALKTIQKDDYFLDKSLLRPGISRISVSIPTKEGAAALYICSLTPTAKQYEDKLAEALRKCKNEWLKNLTN
jgi:DNA-binding IclR family transcriptional regulator